MWYNWFLWYVDYMEFNHEVYIANLYFRLEMETEIRPTFSPGPPAYENLTKTYWTPIKHIQS